MVRTKQGGSILSFVIIGVVLASLLIGGVWALRHFDLRALQKSQRDTEVVVAPTDDKVTTDQSEAQEKEQKKKETTDDSVKTETVTPSQPSDTAGSSPQGAPHSGADQSALPSGGGQVATLPQTGVTDWLSGLSVAVLVGVSMAYVVSRRQVAGL